MGRMSLKPGIGAQWLEKNWKEIYQVHDKVILQGGKKVKPPRYYDKIMEIKNEKLMKRNKKIREKKGIEFQGDSTPERLRVRETCANARVTQRKGIA